MGVIIVFVVFFSTMVPTGATVRNISSIPLPLVDKIAAPLTANIDITDMKSVIKDYIDHVVKEQVASSLNESVETVFKAMEKLKSELRTPKQGLYRVCKSRHVTP